MKQLFRPSIIFLILTTLTQLAAQVVYPGEVDITGTEEVVFDYTTDACSEDDIPDTPARFFRDANGQIQMLAVHYVNYRSIGSDFDNLTRDCSAPVFDSDHNSNPSTFNNNEWLSNSYTLDGNTIYSIVHNEYTPDTGNDYWYNTLTFATSTDAGQSYTQAASPDHYLAGTPYELDTSNILGIFGGSSPVYNANDGYYYAMVHLEAYGLQDWGAGLIRTQDLSNPDNWRGWDGEGFNVEFKNPYHDVISDPADHILAPVSKNKIAKMCGSLTYNTYFEKYMVVEYGEFFDPPSGQAKYGFFYSLSEDLINWSHPVMMYESPIQTWWDVGGVFYPNIVDHTDTTRNFERPGRECYLYFTKWNSGTYDRDLVRVPIRFNKKDISTITVNSVGDDGANHAYIGDASTGTTIANGEDEITLRSAIETIKASPDTGATFTINFNLPGDGPHTISPGSSYPTLTGSMIIDGFSQAGAVANANSLANGNNATVQIEIDGSSAGTDVNAFVLDGASFAIKGLSIYGFDAGIFIENGSSSSIEGCFLGFNALGNRIADEMGVTIFNTDSITIGGTSAASQNVISGNVIITETGAENNVVSGNYIGASPDGATSISSGMVIVDNGASFNTINSNLISGSSYSIHIINSSLNTIQQNITGTNSTGLTAIAQGTIVLTDNASLNTIDDNLISGTGNGIEINQDSYQNTITNNLIGTDASGTSGLNAGLYGILVQTGAHDNQIGTVNNGNIIGGLTEVGIGLNGVDNNVLQANYVGTNPTGDNISIATEGIWVGGDSEGNVIGGTSAGEGNIITNNGGSGISLSGLTGQGNAFLGNAIYNNGLSGIGDMTEIDVPRPDIVIAMSQNTTLDIIGNISGESNSTYRIELFNNSECDASGSGEGETFLGFIDVTTDASGIGSINETINASVVSGDIVTATATGENNSTSAFSDCVDVFNNVDAPTMTLSGSTFSFDFPSFIQPIASADIVVTNSGAYELEWEGSSNADWLTLSPNMGTTSAGAESEIGLNVDLSDSSVGTYSALITLNSNDYLLPSQSISMTIHYGTGGPTNISHSPDTVFVDVSEGPDTPASFFMLNIGNEAVDWTAGFTGINWVNSVTPNSGSTSPGDSVEIFFNVRPANLQPGENSGLVWVSLNPELTQVMEVPVMATLLVPSISVYPESIEEDFEPVASDPTLSFQIMNTGDANLIWTVDDFIGNNWTYSFNPSSGATPPGDSTTISFNVRINSLDEGLNTGIIPISSNDQSASTLQIPVTINYTSNSAPNPELTIDSPLNNATFFSSDVNIHFSAQNFNIGAESDSTDGHLHYQLNNNDPEMHYSENAVQLSGLSLGEQTVILWLVDHNHNSLEPHVADTVLFTIEEADELYNPYDDVSYDLILLESISGDNINGSNNFLNRMPEDAIMVYETNEGRFGKLQIGHYGETLTLAWSTYDDSGQIYSSGESLVVSDGVAVDLDEGGITTDESAQDFSWDVVNAIDRWFNVENSAQFGLYGYWGITRQMVQNQSGNLSNANIAAVDEGENNLEDGQVLLYRTNQNRYGKLQVEEYGPALRIRWWTYNNQGNIHSMGDSLVIASNASCDLEMGQQTPNNSPHRDFYWEQVSPGEMYLVPRNASQFGVYSPNHAPTANDQYFETNEGTSVEIVLNAVDVDGDDLMYDINEWPQYGSLSGTPPSFVYAPNPEFIGGDQFVYTVTDGELSSSATVYISVIDGGGNNSAPEFNNFSDLDIVEDSEENSVYEISANDLDGDMLTFSLSSNNESVSWADEGQTNTSQLFRLVVSPNWYGSAVFTAIVSDGELNDTLNFNVNVTPVNDSPTASDLTIETQEDIPVAFDFIGNDIDGDELTFIIVSNPQHGTLNDGVYSPAENYFGEDTFQYASHDGTANSEPATVIITVTPINDSPIVNDLEITCLEDNSVEISLDGTDVDGDDLTFSVLTPPGHGTFNNGVYSPAENYFGEDTFTFTASDGIELSNEGVVTIEVESINDAPEPFELLSPVNTHTISISNATFNDTLRFKWTTSHDIDNDEITYDFVGEGSLALLENSLIADSDTSVWILYSTLANYVDSLSVIQGDWSAIAIDLQDSTLATNGPFSLTIDLNELSIDDINEIPSLFALHQNYPNPFNPTTTLRYDLPEDTHVQIVIYDIMGQQVKTLINEEQNAGFKAVVWDATNHIGQPVSAGMYLYQISAGGFNKTIKMVLLK